MEFIQLNLLADSRSVYYYNSMSLTDMHILLCRYVLTYIYIYNYFVCVYSMGSLGSGYHLFSLERWIKNLVYEFFVNEILLIDSLPL